MRNFLILTFAMLGLAACSNDPSAGGLPASGGASATVTANQCTAPVDQVIDYGQRRTAGAALNVRGAFNDIAINPANNYPAYVFGETNTTAGVNTLKYQFWDGTSYKTETILGGLTTTFVRLVFLTTGKPLVFWGNGATSLYMATRSTASISTVGVWTAAVIDSTSTAIRAVDASVNPSNQVLVSFAVNTTSANIKAAICTSNCDVFTSYTAMTSDLDATAGTAMNQMGVGWCRHATGYFPMVSYSDAANAILTSCRDTTLSNCTNGANWTTDITLTGSGANLVGSQLYVDSSTLDSTAYMVVKHAAGLRPYTYPTCGTNVAVTAADPGANHVVATATIGNAWFNLGFGQGNFHVVANDALTMVKYFNQPTATFDTAAWTASVAPHVETAGAAGLGAAGLTRGGIAVDTTGDQMLITYGRTLLVTPTQTFGNIVLAYNECMNGTCSATTLGSSAAATGMFWANTPIDNTGQIQRNTTQVPSVGVAATSTGRPAAAYIDFSVGISAEPVTGALLKYIYRDGATVTDQWITSTIPTNSAPQSPSIAFDHLDRPWVGWFETAVGGLRYYLAMNPRSDGLGYWSVFAYPITDAAANTLPVMNQTSVAMYYSAGVAKPVLIILRNPAATKGVSAARFNLATLQWDYQQEIIALTGAATPGGAWLTSDFDTSGNIVVAVHDTGTGAGASCTPTAARCVRTNYSINGGQTWGTAGQIYSGAAEGLKVKLNPVTSRPAVSFFNRAVNLVRYKYCTAALASCNSSINWADIGTGIVDGITGVSGLTDTGAAANAGLLNVGLTFTVEGVPFVVWPRGAGAPAQAHLMVAKTNAAATAFDTPTILRYNGVGNESAPVAANAGNFALSWNPQSIRTVTGALHTIYVGPGNFLYATSCGD
ncbi:MAG: hypothetical protein SGJ18_03900 [Pseudomonadota bacterium]|nr:hypothetical protein [Pseudomonadota bacterium]